MTAPVEVVRGSGPVVLGLPHTGTWLPDAVRAALNDRGRELTDTDWYIHELYDGLLPEATTVRATFHRYVIDANRGPDDQSLYPGRNTTGLVPLTDFDGAAIWRQEPGPDEVAARLRHFHEPYHAALAAEIDRARARHGVAILFDCHSIRSTIPFLFDGLLPHFNIGTNDGTTCAALIETATRAACLGATGFDTVVNGRFKGGWSTRHYGRPGDGIHAIQMEIAQRAYLAAEAPPWTIDRARADATRAVLAKILATLDRLARSGALARV